MADDPAAYARRYFDRIGAADYPGMLELWAEDGVFEMPFPVEKPIRVEGKAAIDAFYRRARGGMASSAITLTEAFEAGPAREVVIGQGRATTTTGRPYNNSYLWVFDFAPDGRLSRLREWADPLVIAAAFPFVADRS